MNNHAKLLLLAAALSLAGCTTQGSTDDRVARLFVAPDKFANYSCLQIEHRANGTAGRRKQLEGLMAKAGTTPDGRIVSVLAYQAEYTETAGDLSELRRTAAAKNCKPLAALQAPISSR